MAIDTENKRRSVMGILPAPDATIDQYDRLQAAGFYSGYASIVTAMVIAAAYRIFMLDRVYRLLKKDTQYRIFTKDIDYREFKGGG